jgi:hypothetical protein
LGQKADIEDLPSFGCCLMLDHDPGTSATPLARVGMAPQIFPSKAKIVRKPRLGTTRLKKIRQPLTESIAKVLSLKVSSGDAHYDFARGGLSPKPDSECRSYAVAAKKVTHA